MGLLLEVGVHHERDVSGALEGGADRLSLATEHHTSPDLTTAAAVLRASDVPVRVLLRLNDGLTTQGGEFTRLVGLAEEYLALGAEGVVFGFLDADTRIDLPTSLALTERLPGVPWTLHHAIDAALEIDRAFRDALTLPGLTAIQSGGSPRGLSQGYDDLLSRAESHHLLAARLMPSGGLLAEHVPWFTRAGVSQFHVGRQVRPGGSTRAYVDAPLVRSWRLLLDH